MSERFSGGFITKTPVVPTTSSASGIWTLDQQEQAQQAGIWPQQPPPPYIEDVFSTWLYTGNSSTQTITNGIDLAGDGGLIWLKKRSADENHYLWDSARNNFDNALCSNLTIAQFTQDALNVSSTGFSFSGASYNNSGDTYASWTFRKKPKFFDVVTWTGTGTVNHNLGSTPGFWVYKNTGATGNWFALARKSDGTYEALYLNQTSATVYTGANAAAVGLTSTTFDPSLVFGSAAGQSYVGYAFAHNAGGFGLTGTDNVISCGSYASISGGSPVVTLGYEPQWIMIKSIGDQGDYGNWGIWDSMRGLTVGSGGTSGFDPLLDANRATQEGTTYTESGDYISPTATGFIVNPTASNWSINNSGTGSSYIYIAIRRGPMRTPTDATKVFTPGRGTDAASTFITTGFPSDFSIQRWMGGADGNVFSDRLRGFSPADATASPYLVSNTTGAEVSATATNFGYINTGFQIGSNNGGNWWALNFRRAPGFFDEVCYTGTGTAGTTFSHNLSVAPELMIFKPRSNTGSWVVYSAALGASAALNLNATSSAATGTSYLNNTSPTSSVFTVGSFITGPNETGTTYVWYGFATCAGVSKVGSYTGNGSTQTINCGFTGGARFVLIKRTDSTGDWYVYDTARGMTTLTDPYLRLNSTAAESATLGSVTTVTTGFAVNASILAAINTSGASYIFLAIA